MLAPSVAERAQAMSPLSDMAEGSAFKPVIGDSAAEAHGRRTRCVVADCDGCRRHVRVGLSPMLSHTPSVMALCREGVRVVFCVWGVGQRQRSRVCCCAPARLRTTC